MLLLLSYIPESLRALSVDILVGFGVIVLSAIALGVKRALRHLKTLMADNKPNGGSSLRDAIDRISNTLARLEAEVRGRLELESGGYYLTDSEGKCLWVSSVWVRLTGLSSSDALGDGWIAGIHEDYRGDVWDRWKISSRTKIPFDFIFKTAAEILVQGKSVELIDQAGLRVGFLGVISVVSETEAKKV